MIRNGQWTLARKPPGGWPVAEDFAWSETALPSPAAGQMSTRTLYLSLDPYQWGRRRGGVEAVGEVCHGRTVSQVVESRMSGFQPGDFVFNTNGWQTHGLTGDGVSVFGYMFPRKLDPSVAPLSTAVGVHGHAGPHRLRWPRRSMRTADGRDGRRVRGLGRRGASGRPDRQDHRVSRRRHRRYAGKVPVRRRRTGIRRLRFPSQRNAARRSRRGLPRRRSTSISRTSAARCSKRCCRC